MLGLVSPGGVHSHTDHLYKIVEAAKNAGVKEICIHAFLDGRDTDPNSGLGYIQGLQGRLDEIGAGKIVTVSGRDWSMDRDKRWDRLNKSWKMLVEGKAETGQSAEQVIKDSYSDGVTDEFMEPHIIDSELGCIDVISKKDEQSVVLLSYELGMRYYWNKYIMDHAFYYNN